MVAGSALELIRRGADTIVSEAQLAEKLSLDRPLIIKAGFDPTAPDLHLGHTVLLRKLRHFQELGHRVIFLIGDATALVGDPSGQTITRQVLTWEAVSKNAATYKQQVSKILLTQPDRFEIRYNSEWFLGASPQRRTKGLEAFDFSKFVTLASRTTVARLIERDDFQQRMKAGKPVSFLELFYPLMQGYDSVKIAEQYGSCDVELGGTDQIFNLLMGRQLLESYGHKPQIVLTMPLLEGTDGIKKMSKSLGNHISIDEPPGEMFGKIMSIPDPLIIRYFTLLTDMPAARLKELGGQIKERSINPRDAKVNLAVDLVSTYHDVEAAQAAKQEFFKIFSRRQQPSDMPEVRLPEALGEAPVDVIDLLVEAKLAKTKNEARRLLKQGAVKLNGTPIKGSTLTPAQAAGGVLQVGTRHFRKLISAKA